ncbi:MAG TPA: DoxX family membrane protein [Pseudonocardia sp.]|jgi:uncharacterized membrane protein YphA (DoxX/SURF4 family)/ElaB/YqjD/DUF883 family membrane-anchored ribosome-binding protein|nr:DoxX family membrane protein [Pseudonocardia sp.]
MLLRRVARPLLAGIFITGGIAQLRDPEGHAKAAHPVLDQVAGLVPVEQPPSSVTLVRVDGGVKVGAGVLLALGKAPRLAATALAATLVPTTLAGHRFWEEENPELRSQQQIHFVKNLGLLGGLMLAAADTEGKPSLAWRARRAGRTSAATAELLHQDITDGLSSLTDRAGEVAGRAGSRAGEIAGQAGSRAGEVAGRAGSRAGEVVDRAGHRAGEVAGRAGEVAGRAGARAGEVAELVGSRASSLADRAGDRAGAVADLAGERLGDQAGRLLDEAQRWRDQAEKRTARLAKRARKAGKRASKRATKEIKRASKQADRRIQRATKRADALRAELPKRTEHLRAAVT